MTNNYERCREDIRKLLKSEVDRSETITAIANKYGLSRKNAGKRIRNVEASMRKQTTNNTATSAEPVSEADKYEYGVNARAQTVNSNGTSVHNDIIKVIGRELPSDEEILEAHGYSPLTHKVKERTASIYEQQKKGGEIITLYATKTTICVRTLDSVVDMVAAVYAEEKRLGKRFFMTRPLLNTYDLTYSPDGITVVIFFTDTHVGMYAWGKETPENFDMPIAFKSNSNAIKNIVRKLRAMKIKIKQILFVTGGDIIHIDNDDNATTKHTPQKVDGRPQKIILETKKHLIEIVSTLAELAPVEYIYVDGNHDRILGWCLAQMVSDVFADKKDCTDDESKMDGKKCVVKFDIDPRPNKYRIIGEAMVCFTHGEAPDSRLADLARNLNMDAAVKCKLQIVYAGHQHIAKVIPFAGGYVERVPTTAPPCQWSTQMCFNYVEDRYINAYLFDGSATPPDTIRGSIK